MLARYLASSKHQPLLRRLHRHLRPARTHPSRRTTRRRLTPKATSSTNRRGGFQTLPPPLAAVPFSELHAILSAARNLAALHVLLFNIGGGSSNSRPSRSASTRRRFHSSQTRHASALPSSNRLFKYLSDSISNHYWQTANHLLHRSPFAAKPLGTGLLMLRLAPTPRSVSKEAAP